MKSVAIKTKVLGLKLGDVSSEKAVEKALTKATGKYPVITLCGSTRFKAQ